MLDEVTREQNPGSFAMFKKIQKLKSKNPHYIGVFHLSFHTKWDVISTSINLLFSEEVYQLYIALDIYII